MGTLRVWAETLSFEVLRTPETLRLLRDRGLTLLAAVRPWELAHVGALCLSAHGSGVPLGLWPMIDDSDGRWASAGTLERFARFVSLVLDTVPPEAPIAELAVDLELPFGLAKSFVDGLRARKKTVSLPRNPSQEETLSRFDALSAMLTTAGVRRVAAAMPMVLIDPHQGQGLWQNALGTPVLDRHWDHISVMAYSSLFEGWSARSLNRRAALSLLRWCATQTLARHGPRAGISLGAIGPGAFGTEPTYRSPHELAQDVSLCRREGVEDLTLFDLGGAISRGPAERWLDAFVDGTDALPRASSLRVDWLTRAACTVAQRFAP